MFGRKLKSSAFFRLISFVQLTALLVFLVVPSSLVHAQTFSVLSLPKPGQMVTASEKFIPPLLKGVSLHKENPLVFDFIIDPGNAKLSNDELQNVTKKLVKYFLASLTIPDNDFWVNLSPYEQNKIIPKAFGETEMGRDLLAQDYILKQLSASLIYPEKDLGQDFWNRVYQKAQEKFGTTDIPVNTFNKVWIVPEKAVILETDTMAYVTRSRLKVMMEEDYIALDKNRASEVLGTDRLNNEEVNKVSSISSDVVREVIIPEIEREVNEGKNFSQLRQIYNALVLAVWFRDNLRNNILNEIFTNQSKILGIDIEDKSDKEKIYQQYLSAYRQGVFNYIKEDVEPLSGESIPRKYFSGGALLNTAEIRDTNQRVSVRPQDGGIAGALAQGVAAEGELKGAGGQSLSGATVALKGVGSGGDINRENRDKSTLAEAWSNRQVLQRIVEMFSQDQLIALGQLFDQLKTASPNQVEGIEKQINAILNQVNAQRLLSFEGDQQFYQRLVPAQKIWVESKVDSQSRAAALDGLLRGEVFIQIIAGGAATRMKEGLTALKIEGMEEKDYRIWNVNVWDILRKIKTSNPDIADPKLRATLEALKSIEIPEYAKFYTAGQRSLFAIAEGINNLTQDETQRMAIRQNLKIVLHINEDIRESVVQDLINNNFFGFNSQNIILVNGGYGDSFTVKDGKVDVKVEENKITWNHGFALTELDWYKGFTVDNQGRETPTQGSVFDELQKSGAVFGLARRINDGVLLHPQGAMDLDFLAAAIQIQKDVPGANLVLEAMKNPPNEQGEVQKGGLALATPEMGPFGLLLEGVNAKDPNIQGKLTQLTEEAKATGGIPYNRFYFVYNLPEIRRVLEENGGLPMTLKYKEGRITPEVPAGDVTQIQGVNAVIAQRQSDFLIDNGLIPGQASYKPGEGALIHDYKQPIDLPMVSALADYLDQNYTLPQDMRDRLMGSESIQNDFDAMRQSEFFPEALRALDLQGLTSELRNTTNIDSGRLLFANEEIQRVQRSIDELRTSGDTTQQRNVVESLERELSFWQTVQRFLAGLAGGESTSVATTPTVAAQQTGDAFAEEVQARLAQQAGADTPVVVNVAQDFRKGGIDLNPANLRIEINKENGGVHVEFDPKLLEEIRSRGIEGFIPIIINIQPMESVLPLLSQNAEVQQLQAANI